MTDDIAPPEFHIHFEGEGARSHTVPGSALAQAIESLQRSIHLLAFAYEGLDLKERLRFSYDMERKYAVVVKVPRDGGYDIPYIIGNTASTLFDPQDVRIVTEQHQASLAAVQANDPQALKRIIPHAPIRRQVVSALQKMQPPKRMAQKTGSTPCITNTRRPVTTKSNLQHLTIQTIQMVRPLHEAPKS